MTVIGFDYSAGRLTAAQIKAAGGEFVCRYTGTEGLTKLSAKNITKSEYDGLIAGGVSVFLNYEYLTTDTNGGYPAGAQAAQRAKADADAFGYSGPILFSADKHLSTTEVAEALSYLDGAASILGRDRVGAYGFREFIQPAHDQNHASYFWLCGSRPAANDAIWKWLNIYQRNTGTVNIGGIQCDINELINPINFGTSTGELDMPLTDADVAKVVDAVWSYKRQSETNDASQLLWNAAHYSESPDAPSPAFLQALGAYIFDSVNLDGKTPRQLLEDIHAATQPLAVSTGGSATTPVSVNQGVANLVAQTFYGDHTGAYGPSIVSQLKAAAAPSTVDASAVGAAVQTAVADALAKSPIFPSDTEIANAVMVALEQASIVTTTQVKAA